MDDKTKELFKQAYEECKAEDIGSFSDMNWKGFVQHCEELYKMKTDDFRKWFEDQGYEGNPEQQMWYRISTMVQ